LTADDIRQSANRYFNDAGRVTVTLSNGAAIAGVDGTAPLDALVAAISTMQPAPEESAVVADIEAPDLDALGRDRADAEPVSIVAMRSESSPLVDVAFLVHAGAGMDPNGKKGLAALTAALVSEGGSSRYSIEKINDAMYPMAAGFSAQVVKEMTRLSGKVHKDKLAEWYKLASGQMLTPGWRDQEFSRIKTQLINQIRTDLVGNNDEELGKEVLYSELYGADHPYGSLNLGDSAELESITLEDVKKFYADYYTIRNVMVGLVAVIPLHHLAGRSCPWRG
jgi:zinc protease